MSEPRTGRFAPSPTGRMHLGNARTALLAWLQMRAAKGRLLLRIEDLDRARCRPELVDEILLDLAYLGLDHDGEVALQSQRTPMHRQALGRLVDDDLAYRCFCTRAEIARAASAPHGPSDDGPRYPGTCAGLSSAEALRLSRTKPFAYRFRVPEGRVEFEDLVHGTQREDVAGPVGDFVIWTKEDVASYQLAVVVDDAAAGVTDVLRADDLLPSTARQLLLYRALGAAAPSFAHVPLVLASDGGRLAKRSGAATIGELRRRGVPGRTVVGLLAALCGLSDGRPVDASALLGSFSLAQVPREPVRVDETDLARRLGLAAAPGV